MSLGVLDFYYFFFWLAEHNQNFKPVIKDMTQYHTIMNILGRSSTLLSLAAMQRIA